MNATTPDAPRFIQGDSYNELWEIPCPDCGHPNTFVLGIHRLVADLWVDDDRIVEHCPECGTPLPDERDTALLLWPPVGKAA